MNLRKLLISLGACLTAGGLGGLFTAQSVDSWYSTLNKPLISPPNWVFGPVWTFLYALMGIALYIVWRNQKTENNKLPFIFFASQLILNVAWSAVFFGFHSISGGIFVIVALWIAIAATIQQFHKRSKLAAWLLIPYLLWVSFAGVLNYMFLKLN